MQIDCASRPDPIVHLMQIGPRPSISPEQSCRSRISLSRENIMDKFKVGDHVRWNSEAGLVSGRIIKVHHVDFDYKGHRHRASQEEPQYEIKSDRTEHIAAHKDAALTKIG
jgi:hypothetical protein